MSSAYRTCRTDSFPFSVSAVAGSPFTSTSQRNPSRHPPSHRDTKSIAPSVLPAGFRLAVANVGDHMAIRQFLAAVFQGPKAIEFAAALDEPTYEPSDRLLIKRGDTIVAHVFTRIRGLRVGDLVAPKQNVLPMRVTVPVGQVRELAALPEYQGQGLALALLNAAVQSMFSEGAMLAVTRTNMPEYFSALGWESLSSCCASTVDLRVLLRELIESPRQLRQNDLFRSPQKDTVLAVRPWRQIELNGLRTLYDRELGEKAFGVWTRSEDQWRWLVEQRNYDRVYVVTERANDIPEKTTKRGRSKTELDLVHPSDVLAYAVQRGDQVLEFAARDGNAAYSRPLLARICADAMERGFHELTLHARSDDPAHAWLRAAGCRKTQVEGSGRDTLLGKVLQIDRLLQHLLPTFGQRLSRSGPANWQLGLLVDDHRVLIRRRGRRLQLESTVSARNHVEMSRQIFLGLVCGQINPLRAASEGAIVPSTKLAMERVSQLFPQSPFAGTVWDA